MAKKFIDLAHSRKTTYEFSRKPVPQPQLKKILEAGRWAPSALNSQPWQFVVIKSRKTIELVIKNAYYGMFHGEPTLMVAIVLPREYYGGELFRGMKSGRLGTFEAMLSVSMPALQMALQAEELGISSCIVSVDEKGIAKALGLRDGDCVPVAVGFGFAAKGADVGVTHKRRELSNFVHNERFKAGKDE